MAEEKVRFYPEDYTLAVKLWRGNTDNYSLNITAHIRETEIEPIAEALYAEYNKGYAQAKRELLAVLKPVYDAAESLPGGEIASLFDETWNPDSHFPTLTLTVQEVRNIVTATGNKE